MSHQCPLMLAASWQPGNISAASCTLMCLGPWHVKSSSVMHVSCCDTQQMLLCAVVCHTSPDPSPWQVDVVHRGQVKLKGVPQAITVMLLEPVMLSGRTFPSCSQGARLRCSVGPRGLSAPSGFRQTPDGTLGHAFTGPCAYPSHASAGLPLLLLRPNMKANVSLIC